MGVESIEAVGRVAAEKTSAQIKQAIARAAEKDLFAGVSGFVVRRVLALGYCAAFLSLLAQVDGLFGCGAIHPPKAKGLLSGLPSGGVPFFISVLAIIGSLIAGAALLAARTVERHSLATFGVLWACFATCVELAPALYPQLEDKLLLEAGIVALFLVVSGEGKLAKTARGVGRILAAWLLFRSVFSSGAEKVTGSCGAWRNLSAMKDIYQIEPFPLPAVWLLYMAPPIISQALTLFVLYVELALCPLVLSPWNPLSCCAAISQLLVLATSCFVANRGYTPICHLALVFSLLNDKSHSSLWSDKILAQWGYREDDDPELDGFTEDEDQDEPIVLEPEEDDPADEFIGDFFTVMEKSNMRQKRLREQQAKAAAIPDFVWAVLVFVLGYIISLAVVVLTGSQVAGPTKDEESQGASRIINVAVVMAALLGAVLSVTTLLGFVSDIIDPASPAPAAAWPPEAPDEPQSVPATPAPVDNDRKPALVAVLGSCVWALGLLQLSMDILPAYMPQPVHSLASGLEQLHIVHALGAGAKEMQACPRREGRFDLVVQGSGHSLEFERTGKAAWLSLSSRFLLSAEEQRPVWLTPYVPRLDKDLWQLAQRLRPKKSRDTEVPKWTLRLMSQLSARQGAAAQLSAGHWGGLGSMIHGTGSVGGPYGKLPVPLPVLYIMRTVHAPVEDKHSNKWWSRKDAQIVRLLEEDELGKLSKKFVPKCSPLPWAEWPVSEALTGLIIASFLGKLVIVDKGQRK